MIRALSILLLLAGPLAARAEGLRVDARGCDSLRVAGDGAGWERLEEDSGEGWSSLGPADAANAGLLRPAPAAGASLAWRFMKRDGASGLPVYSREWSWARPWPALDARLEGGSVVWLAASDCRPERLELRLYDGESPVDLRILDANAGREFLPEDGWSTLRLGWPGQNPPLELRLPGARVAATLPAIPVPIFELPPAPRPLAEGPGWLDVACESAPRVTAGPAAGSVGVEPAGEGRWRLRADALAQGECWISVCVADGRCGLPLLWTIGATSVQPVYELTGPDGIEADGGAAPAGSVWHWLDGNGRGGSQPAAEPLILGGLSGPQLRLQLVDADGVSLWNRRVALEWPAPVEVVWSSRGLLEGRLSLGGSRSWTPDGVDLEIRRPQGVERLGGSLPLPLPSLAADTSWTLRWRGRLRASRSAWSPWTTLSLWPGQPEGLSARAERDGVRLTIPGSSTDGDGGLGPWLQDGFEWRRIVGGDTLSLGVGDQASLFDAAVPAGTACRYQARRVAGDRASTWSKPVELHALDDGRGWIPGPGGRWAPRLLRVAEARQIAADPSEELEAVGFAVPESLPVEGQEGWFRDGQRPMVALDWRQTLAWINELNARVGYAARYDLGSGSWTPGATGGFRLPAAGAVPPQDLEGERFELSEWREGMRIAGTGWLRGPAPSPRGEASAGYRGPTVDVGVRLLLAPVE